MTEEKKHYMITPGVPTTYDLIGSRIRRYNLPKTLLDPESEGAQVTCDLTGSRTRHTG
jgi:hypothetical protein